MPTNDELIRDLDCFYGILTDLRTRLGHVRRLSDCTGRDQWPTRGVYFFFEPDEYRAHRVDELRVVRVGTHAVSAGSQSTLWGRLRTHRGGRDGRGNHRGSVFRRHVGAALFVRDRAELGTWGVRSSASTEVRQAEAVHERRVSQILGAMTVVWVEVPDAPGTASPRSILERNSVALLSNQLRPIDLPSPHWLGSHSDRSDIRQSGLWNVDYVSGSYDPAFLQVFTKLVSA
jgi:hypothetical protein